MSVPTGLPAPAVNQTLAGNIDAASDLASSDIIVAVGDFTGGTDPDEFSATAHGLVTGDHLFLLYKDDPGVVTGAVGTRFRALRQSANLFQLTDADGVVIENTADGDAVLLKGTHRTSDALVQTVILPRLVVANGDFTAGADEDMFTPTIETGTHGLEDTDSLKLLFKESAGVVVGIDEDETVFATATTTALFVLSATSGGAEIANTADGLAVFLKTT